MIVTVQPNQNCISITGRWDTGNYLGFEATLSRLWMPAGSRAMLVVLRLYSSKPSYPLPYSIWTDFCERPDLYQINNLKCKFLVSFRNMKFLNPFKMLKYWFLYNGIHGGSNFFLIAWFQVKKTEITVPPSQSPSIVLLPNSL